jgi:hypothetical protein
MQHTLTLRLTNTAARPEIARQFVAAVAVRAGLTALAADRAAAQVQQALTGQDIARVQLEAALDGKQATVVVSGGGQLWCDQLAAALAPLGAGARSGSVELTLRRTPLRPV